MHFGLLGVLQIGLIGPWDRVFGVPGSEDPGPPAAARIQDPGHLATARIGSRSQGRSQDPVKAGKQPM